MAEFVEFRAEEWMSELNVMEKICLFDNKEIKCIATRRKEFEYKIQRLKKSKEDFLKYIQYELDLHRIIKGRRKKRRISARRADIDFSQARRIANLFKQVVHKFQDDVKLWMSFFKFCKEVKFHSLMSQMLVRMLQIHSNKSDLWKFAANWEFQQCNSMNNARQFLTKGLRHHPSSHELYEELFKLEIKYLNKKKKGMKIIQKENEQWVPDETTKTIVEGKVAEVVYKSAVEVIQTVDFKVSMLQIADNLKAPLHLRNKILQDIVKEHLNEELAWVIFAKRELSGLPCNLNKLKDEEPMEVDEDKEKKTTVRDNIQNSINVYEEAVKRINTVKMWSYYLDHVLEINENRKSLPVFKGKLLQNAFEGAMLSGNMEEKYYIQWIEILRKSKKMKQHLEVLERGVEQHPKSIPIWHALLTYYFSVGEEEKGMKLFKEAVQDAVQDAVPLWKLVVKYLQLKSSPKIEDVFKEGIQRGGDVALALKTEYIEWLVQKKGIEEARKVFDSPEMQLPPSLKLFNKMVELEESQPEVSVQNVRKCYNQACNRFGENDINIWLDYIKFEMRRDIKNVNQIHRRAVKTLTPEKVDDFISEYNKFKTDIAT